MRGAEILFIASLAGLALGAVSLFRSKDMSGKWFSSLLVIVSIGGAVLAILINAGVVP